MERLKNLKVEDFETDPIIVSPTAPISEVIGALKQSGAYEVFIQDGKKVGALTMREILKASDISNMRTSTLMFYVSKLSPDTTVGKAAKLMNDYRVRALPIVENGKIRGAVTTRSLC
ncbi:MAG TPA: CBS domain-containing protein, partial [Candidatus Bathyarchaeota archaeon]|nr:CBS domain-containing protein [Candidatus Bathyarchaeota archaeon]